MTDHDALYRAILAHPGDDTPRLVYADWLQENDRPEEAEFIRLGCRLEAESPDHPDYVEWQTRREELALWLGTHAPVTAPKLAGGLEVRGEADWWRISRRGFPTSLQFEAKDQSGTRPMRALAAGLGKAFAVLPTRWLAVRYITVGQLAELLRQPTLEQLDALTVRLRVEDEPQDEAARLVADCPRLRHLRGLGLRFDFGEGGAHALARSDHLGRVEGLTVHGDSLTAAAVRALTSAAWFRNLRSLTIRQGLPDAAFEALCGSGPFPRLHTLEVTACTFPRAWEAFARSGAFPALTRLVAVNDWLQYGRAAHIAAAAWFRPAHLDFTVCGMGDDEAAALAAAPWLGAVRHLNMLGNGLGPGAVASLAGSRRLGALRHLDLSNNTVGVAGLRAVAKNPALRGLVGLEVGGRHFENGSLAPEHFHEFLSDLDVPGLRRLSLRFRPVGGRAARLLAGPKFQSLTRLDLAGCRLTEAAVSALLTAPALQNLVELDLSYNYLQGGFEPLTDRHTLPRLAKCFLMANRIPAALANRLRRRPGVEV